MLPSTAVAREGKGDSDGGSRELPHQQCLIVILAGMLVPNEISCLDPVCGNFWTFYGRRDVVSSLQLRLKIEKHPDISAWYALICATPADPKPRPEKV